MRESLIVMPKADNLGNSLNGLRDEILERLAYTFGGTTLREDIGAWQDETGKLYREPVFEFATAYDPSLDGNKKLRSIAEYIGWKAQQLGVFVRYADGESEILDTSQLWQQSQTA